MSTRFYSGLLAVGVLGLLMHSYTFADSHPDQLALPMSETPSEIFLNGDQLTTFTGVYAIK